MGILQNREKGWVKKKSRGEYMKGEKKGEIWLPGGHLFQV